MSLAEVINAALDYRLANVRVAIPGQVEYYDAAKQTATVQPLVQDRFVDGAEELVESLPALVGVPVAFPSGGGFVITFPLAKGDTGLLVLADRPLDQWLAKGGVVDPVDVRTHSLAGAVFYPGLHDSKHKLASASASDLVIGDDDGDALMTLKGDGSILIGRSAAKSAVLFEDLKTAYDAHTHPTGVGPSGPPAVPLPSNVASSKVKIKA